MTFLIPILDIFRRKWRQRKIQEVAKALNWDFFPSGRIPSHTPLSDFVERNVIEGTIEDIPARVCDVPVRTEFTHRGGGGTIDISPPDTILILDFEQRLIPSFVIRPRTWADRFVKPVILGENFVVEGNHEEMILRLFDKAAIDHYEQQQDLHIRVAGRSIHVQFKPDNYLLATKERYLDLIAEGKYLTRLIREFLDEDRTS